MTTRPEEEESPSPVVARAQDAVAQVQETAQRVQETAQRVMTFFPVRVFRRFTLRNGNVLAAGASYQALFAMFAAVYVAFAGVGLWLGGNTPAIDRLINVVNRYLPGIIGDTDGAAISRESVHEIAGQSATTLGVTGVVAVLVLLWTAVSWIRAIRRTVRDIFGLAAEPGAFLLLQLRDLIAAGIFAVLLLLGAALGWVGTSAIETIFAWLGLTDARWFSILGSVIAFAVMFLVDIVTLLLMFRFLTGLSLSTRDVLPGSLLGAAAVAVLQTGFGYLIGKTPSNPLLVTFAVLVGLLLWIRLVMMAILLSAAWVAESADQKRLVLERLTDRERDLQIALVLRDAARIDRDQARAALPHAGFWRRRRAKLLVTRAEENLAAREHDLTVLAPTTVELLATQARLGTGR